MAHGKKVALVSHRSAPKIIDAQNYLIDQLRRRFGADRILHVPVRANLKDALGKEPTHRTRSFLFAAIGAVTAQLLDRQRICFFENGVVSLNLPPVGQVVGARATRTTHPQAMAGFRRVLSCGVRAILRCHQSVCLDDKIGGHCQDRAIWLQRSDPAYAELHTRSCHDEAKSTLRAMLPVYRPPFCGPRRWARRRRPSGCL